MPLSGSNKKEYQRKYMQNKRKQKGVTSEGVTQGVTVDHVMLNPDSVTGTIKVVPLPEPRRITGVLSKERQLSRKGFND